MVFRRASFALAAVLAGLFSTSASGMTQHEHPDPAVWARLRGIIVSFAAANGDPRPTRLRMVETSSTAAWKVLSGSTDSHAAIPVYLVVANGHFVSSGPHPPGAQAPRGTTLFMLLDRRGGYGTVGWGLNRLSPDLHKLGTLTTL